MQKEPAAWIMVVFVLALMIWEATKLLPGAKPYYWSYRSTGQKMFVCLVPVYAAAFALALDFYY
jgi:hypothetical protein